MLRSLTGPWQPMPVASVAELLAPGDVHAWTVDLDEPPADVRRLAALLSDDEAERAARLQFDRDRRRFVMARSALRCVLGHYTGVAPAALRFALGHAGKPALDCPAGTDGLAFNLSHSGGQALIGVARGMAIGVDLEAARQVPEYEAIAKSHFAVAEVAGLFALPQARRMDGFFACWTRKEAYVKAIGGGLSVPLDSFEVSLDPDAPAQLRAIDGSACAAAAWTMWGGVLPTRAWTAIAVDRNPARLQTFSMCPNVAPGSGG
jgi:4'-phosphopantetheinyl transferase